MALERYREEGLGLGRVSARPPARFSAQSDYVLWIQRFELYLREAEIPAAKRGNELASFLEDEPFRVVSQVGLLGEVVNYGAVKTCPQQHFAPAGMELEWQCQLQGCRQKPGESLSGFAGRLRVLADKAFPSWTPKQRLEMARSQFVQGIQSSSAQLKLLQENPETFEGAVELASQVETVEAAQKHLQSGKHTVSALDSSTEQDDEVAAMQQTRASQRGVGQTEQLNELSQQVRQLTQELADLRRPGRRPEKRKKTLPTCWNCGNLGHLRRNCPRRGIGGQDSPSAQREATSRPWRTSAVDSAVTVEGIVEERPTRMLVDTGSAVTIVRESVWREATSELRRQHPLSPVARPVVAANGQSLELCGQTFVLLRVGNLCVQHPVLAVKDITQQCLLGADFLERFGCVIDLRNRLLMAGGRSVPVQLQAQARRSVCHVSIKETTEIPGYHQVHLHVRLCAPTCPDYTGMFEPPFLAGSRIAI